MYIIYSSHADGSLIHEQTHSTICPFIPQRQPVPTMCQDCGRFQRYTVRIYRILWKLTGRAPDLVIFYHMTNYFQVISTVNICYLTEFQWVKSWGVAFSRLFWHWLSREVVVRCWPMPQSSKGLPGAGRSKFKMAIGWRPQFLQMQISATNCQKILTTRQMDSSHISDPRVKCKAETICHLCSDLGVTFTSDTVS